MKFKIEKIEEYDNCVKVSISSEINGETINERFGFSHQTFSDESWRDRVSQWLKKKESERKVDSVNSMVGMEFDTDDKEYSKKHSTQSIVSKLPEYKEKQQNAAKT